MIAPLVMPSRAAQNPASPAAGRLHAMSGQLGTALGQVSQHTPHHWVDPGGL